MLAEQMPQTFLEKVGELYSQWFAFFWGTPIGLIWTILGGLLTFAFVISCFAYYAEGEYRRGKEENMSLSLYLISLVALFGLFGGFIGWIFSAICLLILSITLVFNVFYKTLQILFG